MPSVLIFLSLNGYVPYYFEQSRIGHDWKEGLTMFDWNATWDQTWFKYQTSRNIQKKHSWRRDTHSFFASFRTGWPSARRGVMILTLRKKNALYVGDLIGSGNPSIILFNKDTASLLLPNLLELGTSQAGVWTGINVLSSLSSDFSFFRARSNTRNSANTLTSTLSITPVMPELTGFASVLWKIYPKKKAKV